ncbi:MAG: hypothetical protein HY064_04440 [Bacteroidetes bacterium]|nr:hypothetical protein [Bacteroidota bacterium]
MKSSRLIIILLLLSPILFYRASCHQVKEAVTYKADPNYDYPGNGYIKAFVTDVELDGCKWMLQQESDNKKLEPDGLQPEFEHDSLKVWLKFEPEDRMSVCMAGQTIKVLDIKIR